MYSNNSAVNLVLIKPISYLLGYALAPSFLVVLVSAALHGLGSSFVTVGGMTMMARIFNDKEERAKKTGMSLSVAAGGTLGTYILKVLDKYFNLLIGKKRYKYTTIISRR